MEIISLPIFFCLLYYIIGDLKLVRSVEEDRKISNHTSGDSKHSSDIDQRAKSDNALKEREANEEKHSTGSFPNSTNNSHQQSAPSVGSRVTHTPTTQNPVTPKSNNPSNSKSPKLIDLDIKKKEGTADFNCSEKGNVVTYTPKAGYGFGTVKIKKGSCNCLGSDKVVWEAEDASKHSNKVVIETSSDKQKTLTIYLVDGTTKVFKKVKDGDFVLQNEQTSKGSNPVDSSSVAEAPTDEPTFEQDDSEVSETPESKEDHMTPSYQQHPQDSKPGNSSALTHTPADELRPQGQHGGLSGTREPAGDHGMSESYQNYQSGSHGSSHGRQDRNSEDNYHHGNTPQTYDSTRRDPPMTGNYQNYSQSGSHGSSRGRNDGNRERP